MWIIWFAVVSVLVLTMLFPLVRIFLELRPDAVKTVLGTKKFAGVICNTAKSAFWGALISVAFGYVFAYAVVFAKIPLYRFFALVPVLHLITPPFVGGLSFILLAGRQGFITKTLLGLDVSLYGFWGLLISQILCFFPVAFLICSQNLQNMNSHLIESARSLGAGRIRIFWTVVFPLSFPGLSAAFLFVFVSILSDFGNPLIVAGRYKVLAVEIYTQLTGWVNSSISALLGLVLLIPSVLIFILQAKLVKKYSLKTATIGGKISGISFYESSIAVKIVLTVFTAFLSVTVIAQFVSVIFGSFQKLWGINTSFTAEHFLCIKKNILELKNSLCFAFIGSVISTVLAYYAVYFVYRSDFPLKKTIDTLIQIPAAIPGTFHGLALSLMAASINFHYSKILVTAAIAVGFIPFSYRIISSSMMQLRPSLDEAAFSLGQNQYGVCNTIIAPLCIEGIFNSFVYTMARGIGTVSAVIFLVSFDTPLVSLKILNLAEQGEWGQAAALAFILTVLTFAILAAGNAVKTQLKPGKGIAFRKWME